MSTFTATNHLGAVTWTDGKLDGDLRAVGAVRACARSKVDVGLPGLWGGRAGLRSHPQALATVLAAMPGAQVTGDEIAWEPLPPGAVA